MSKINKFFFLKSKVVAMAQNAPQAERILENMVMFINQHGDEEVARIKESEAQEFTIRSTKYIEEQKQIIDDNFKAELQN